MNLNDSQQQVLREIQYYAGIVGVDANWASAIAMTESSLGQYRISRTGCRGIFQMSGIAMEDLRQAMANPGDDVLEILIGLLFLRLLFRRWGTIEEATRHYCDPNDRGFYVDRMLGYMAEFAGQKAQAPAPESPSANKISWYKRLFL